MEIPIKTINKFKENLAPRIEGYDIRTIYRNCAEHDYTDNTSFFHAPYVKELDYDSGDSLGNAIASIDELENVQAHGRSRSEVLTKMATCIEQLKDHEVYKHDIRFIKLCLSYGLHSESPTSMFEFMEFHGIGKQCAIFYYHMANYFETIKKIELAKKVLNNGLENGSKPQTLLVDALSFLELRHQNSPRSNHKVTGVAATNKRRKLTVYTGIEEKIDTGSKEKLETQKIYVPNIINEAIENRQVADQVLVSDTLATTPHTSGTRRIVVYQDNDDFTEEPANICYNQLVLLNGDFKTSIRQFEQGKPRNMQKFGFYKEDMNSSTRQVIPPNSKLGSKIYQQHGVVTEVISLTKNGDTEVLN